MCDVTLKHPFRCIISGPSSSGKTHLIVNILLYQEYLFSPKRSAGKVFFFYNTWQQSYDRIKNFVSNIEFFQGSPTVEQFENLASPYMTVGGSLFIIDDGLNQATKDLEEIFTTKSHHCYASVILVTQNLFAKDFRTLSINSQYFFLMKNPRDMSQISTFGRQMFPKNGKFIEDCYKKATEFEYSYLLLDFHQTTNQNLRVRSNLFPPNTPIITYYPK